MEKVLCFAMMFIFVVVGRLLWKLGVVIGKRKKGNGSEEAVFYKPN